VNARLAIVCALLPLAWSCSAGGQPGQVAPRRDPNIITAEELQTANASNVYDAIRTLRPEWLSRGSIQAVRGEGGGYTTVVYMDRMLYGAPDMLRQMGLGSVLQVRWFGPSEAQGEFGLSGGMQGVIQVVTRRR